MSANRNQRLERIEHWLVNAPLRFIIRGKQSFRIPSIETPPGFLQLSLYNVEIADTRGGRNARTRLLVDHLCLAGNRLTPAVVFEELLDTAHMIDVKGVTASNLCQDCTGQPENEVKGVYAEWERTTSDLRVLLGELYETALQLYDGG